MSDYESLATKSWDEIPDEQLLPGGSWLLRVRSAKRIAPKQDGQSEQLMIVYEPLEPMDDVDGEQLAALNNGVEYDLAMNRIYVKFWLETGKDYHNARAHFQKHGVEGANLEEAIKASKGTQVIAVLGTRTFTNSAGEPQTEQTATSFTPVPGL